MNKVYVVFVDNGEDYEDEYHWIDKVFRTRGSAENYLRNSGWSAPKRANDKFWHKEDKQAGWTFVRSAWVEKHKVL